MKTQAIEFDKAKALELYNAYRAHRGAHTKEDAEIERIYYQISRGRKVIRAMASIRAAGVDAAAIVPAAHKLATQVRKVEGRRSIARAEGRQP